MTLLTSAHPFRYRRALVVGINQYENGFRPLTCAVNDARCMAAVLEADFGYDILRKPGAAEQDSDEAYEYTKAEFLVVLEDLAREFAAPDEQEWGDAEMWSPTSNGRHTSLVVYFAGHGLSKRDSANLPVGYLLLRDAVADQPTSWLSGSELIKCLDAIACHHLLVILDCCFAGTFKAASLKRSADGDLTIYQETYNAFVTFPTRQFLTSTSAVQLADDSGQPASYETISPLHADALLQARLEPAPAASAAGVGNSPFAGALLRALQEGIADKSPHDKLITTLELHAYLRAEVMRATQGEQQPQAWSLPAPDGGSEGEFVFQRPDFNATRLARAPRLARAINPYRGLKPYTEAHAHAFFGRAALIAQLRARLQPETRTTVLLGGAGSGKTSLVRAGLLPQLNPTVQADGTTTWRTAFCSLDGEPLSGAAPHHAFQEWIQAQCAAAAGAPLLLVIDQVEYLFTQDAATDNAHLAGVRDTLQSCQNQVHVLWVARSDAALRLQAFLEALHPGLVWAAVKVELAPPTLAELRSMVTGPVERIGVFFESATLVDVIADTVFEHAASLPQLSYLLHRLFLTFVLTVPSDRMIRLAHFLKLAASPPVGDAKGTVFEQLLFSRATRLYHVLEHIMPETAVLLSRLVVRMYGFDERNRPRMVSVPLVDLVYTPPAIQSAHGSLLAAIAAKAGVRDRRQRLPTAPQLAHAQGLVDHLVRLRLVVTEAGEDGCPRYLAIHPALVLNWEMARAWRGQAMATLPLVTRQALTAAAHTWLTANQDPKTLWANRPLDLAPAVATLKAPAHSALNQIEQEFLNQSSIRRRLTQVTRGLGVALTAVVLMYLLQSFLVLNSAARRQELLNSIASINGQSVNSRDLGNVTLAYPLAAYAGSLVTQLLQDTSPAAFQPVIPEQLTAMAELYNFSPQPLPRLSHPTAAQVTAVAWSPDSRIATLANGSVTVWNSYSGTPIAEALAPELENGTVTALMWAASGDFVVTGSSAGAVQLWNGDTFERGRSFTGISGPISTLSLSPDERLLAIGAADSVFIGDMATGATYPLVHDGVVTTALWSPDGKRLFTASSIAAQTPAGEAVFRGRIWTLDDVAHPVINGCLQLKRALLQAAWSPNEATPEIALIRVTYQNAVLWQVHLVTAQEITLDSCVALTGQDDPQVWYVNEDRNPLTSVAWSPTGQRLITTSLGDRALVWNVDDKDCRQKQAQFSNFNDHLSKGCVTILPHATDVYEVHWRPGQANQVVTISADGLVTQWATQTGQQLLTTRQREPNLHGTWSPDGSRLALWGTNATVLVWWFRDDTLLPQQAGLNNVDVYDATWSPDGQRLAIASASPFLRVRDGRTGTLLLDIYQNTPRSTDGNGSYIIDANWSPAAGTSILTIDATGNGRIWDSKSGVLLDEFARAAGLPWTRADWSPEGDAIAIGDAAGGITIALWTGKGLIPATELPVSHNGAITSIRWSPRGDYLAVGDANGLVSVWSRSAPDRAAFALAMSVQHRAGIERVRWATEAGRLLTVGRDGNVLICQVKAAYPHNLCSAESGQHEQILAHTGAPDGCGTPQSPTATPGAMWRAEWAPDDKAIVTVDTVAYTACLWTFDPQTHRFKVAYRLPHDQFIEDVAWSPDGTLIATAGRDQVVRVWYRKTGMLVAVLGQGADVLAVDWSPDGRWLSSAGKSGIVRRWLLDPTELLRSACERSTVPLTEAEVNSFGVQDFPSPCQPFHTVVGSVQALAMRGDKAAATLLLITMMTATPAGFADEYPEIVADPQAYLRQYTLPALWQQGRDRADSARERYCPTFATPPHDLSRCQDSANFKVVIAEAAAMFESAMRESLVAGDTAFMQVNPAAFALEVAANQR